LVLLNVFSVKFGIPGGLHHRSSGSPGARLKICLNSFATVRFWSGLTSVALLFTLLISIGCGQSSGGSDGAACCDDSASEIFLQSKLDDDDGDGLPLDEDFPAINDEDDDIADHTWVKDDAGVYHLFFHNEGHVSGNEIEHYTSTDLQSLDYVGVALRPNPAAWDSHGLWAPHIIKHEDTYYMFYTGVDGDGRDPATKQRVGLAISTDLMTWTRYPGNNCSHNQQCRDPFVIWDSRKNQWVMFATAKSVNLSGVVTVAYSTDLLEWTGAGFIDATRRLDTGVGGQTTGGQSENPHIMSHGGTHYLVFTDWKDPEDSVSVHDPRTIVQYATSSTLTADTLGSANWIYRGYTPDPGVNAIETFRVGPNISIMSQSIANERSGYWVRRRELRLKCVVWGNDFTFDTANPVFPCGWMGGWASPTGVPFYGDEQD
jgi:hypothetical protein